MPIRIKMAVLALATILGLAGWKGLNALIERESPRPDIYSREGQDMTPKVKKSEKEWKAALTPEQFDVMRKCGTERPFTGKFNDFWEKGVYVCAGCGHCLGRARGHLSRRRGEAGRPVPGRDDSLRARRVRGPQARSEVVRVLHSVEYQQQRPVARVADDVVEVTLALMRCRADLGHTALVHALPGQPVEFDGRPRPDPDAVFLGHAS